MKPVTYSSNEAFLIFVVSFALGAALFIIGTRLVVLTNYCVNSGYDSYQTVNGVRYCLGRY